MINLEEVLNSEPREIKKERELFSNLYITKDALAKARIYACLAEDERGSPTECYGFLLGEMNRRSRVVRDVYFAPGQEVNAAHVRIGAEKVIEAGREIRDDYGRRVLGWWHSHANMNPFHSGTDDGNLRTVLNQIAPSNYLNFYEEMKYLDSNIKKTKNGNSSIILCDKHNNSKRLEIVLSELKENPLIGIPVEKLKIRVPIKVSYSFSMVVNARGSPPYVEIGTRRFCPTCVGSKYAHKQIPIKVLDYETGLDLNVDRLKEEVESKLILPPPVVYQVFGWKKGARKKKGGKGKKGQQQVIVSPGELVEPEGPRELVQLGQEEDESGGPIGVNEGESVTVFSKDGVRKVVRTKKKGKKSTIERITEATRRLFE